MSLATLPLPDDPIALRNLAVDLQAELARKDIEIAANAAEIHAKTLYIEKLKMQLAVLRRARFGRSSEKLDHAIEQLELLIGELEADAGAEARGTVGDPDARRDTKQPVERRERRQPVRKPLPPHLPREIITHEAACTCPSCGGTVFSRIGQDEREVLEYVPSSFKVIRHIRPKLSCRACETIVQPPMPSLPIERGRPGPGLLAQVLVAKFCDHTPPAPPGRHLCSRRRRTRSLDLGRLGGPVSIPAGPLGRSHWPPRPRRAGAACRRHNRPGAGARYREDQDRSAVGGRA